MNIKTTICGYVAYVNPEDNTIDVVGTSPALRKFMELMGCKFTAFHYAAPQAFIKRLIQK